MRILTLSVLSLSKLFLQASITTSLVQSCSLKPPGILVSTVKLDAAPALPITSSEPPYNCAVSMISIPDFLRKASHSLTSSTGVKSQAAPPKAILMPFADMIQYDAV